jgi:hypothetical protein
MTIPQDSMRTATRRVHHKQKEQRIERSTHEANDTTIVSSWMSHRSDFSECSWWPRAKMYEKKK